MPIYCVATYNMYIATNDYCIITLVWIAMTDSKVEEDKATPTGTYVHKCMYNDCAYIYALQLILHNIVLYSSCMLQVRCVWEHTHEITYSWD